MIFLRRSLAALALILCFATGFPLHALAHGGSVSYSTWRIEGRRIDVRVRVADLDSSAVPAACPTSASAAGRAVEEYVVRAVSAQSVAGPCAMVAPPVSASARDGWRSIEWTLACPGDDAPVLRVDLLFDALSSHVHFARVDRAGAASVERLLTGEQRTWELSPASFGTRGGASFASYVMLGVEHILSGYDHVAFLIALLLLARTLGEVALLASSFTVAHSLTLALAALGIAHPSARAVEALIGFSIALVAIENVWLLSGRRRFVPAGLALALLAMAAAAGRGSVALSPVVLVGLAIFCVSHFSLLERMRDATRLRAVVAFCFGLAHGFGFAGVLSEIASEPSRLVRGVLGFNVGVEVGQLAIVALLWPLLTYAGRRRGGAPRVLLAEVASALICALGTHWFLERSLG